MYHRFIKQGVILAAVMVGLLGGCSDKNSPKYDQRRYEQLQKADCGETASVLSSKLLMEKPEDFDTAVKRCEDTKSLTFEEYKALADYGRKTGEWDIYAVYPEKKAKADDTAAKPVAGADSD